MMLTPEQQKMAEMVEGFLRDILARPDGTPIDKAAEQWFRSHLFGSGLGGTFALAFQTYVICDLIALYELTARSGVIASAAMIYEKNPELGKEAAAEMAKGMMHDAGERLRLADIDAGPMQ